MGGSAGERVGQGGEGLWDSRRVRNGDCGRALSAALGAAARALLQGR
eukprot:COSAG02_NODE_15093_length_1204_cov_561.848869_1_plen_46_part_10